MKKQLFAHFEQYPSIVFLGKNLLTKFTDIFLETIFYSKAQDAKFGSLHFHVNSFEKITISRNSGN